MTNLLDQNVVNYPCMTRNDLVSRTPPRVTPTCFVSPDKTCWICGVHSKLTSAVDLEHYLKYSDNFQVNEGFMHVPGQSDDRHLGGTMYPANRRKYIVIAYNFQILHR